MIPMGHLWQMQKKAEEEAAAKPRPPYSDTHQFVRVLIAISLALGLAGALLAVNWNAVERSTTIQESVKPGINRDWKSDNVAPLVERLEAESREIYHERAQLAALVGLKEGMKIADVGAGSGFMAEEFARIVGPKGVVYAVDINPKLLERVALRAQQAGLANIKTVLTGEKSVDLPRRSVDVVFVCDTYHHFEYPNASLAGIRRALRNRGELVVVDFHREPGKSEPFILEHVRADKDTFKKEIEAAGFRFIREEQAPFLKDNYVLRFRKRGD